MQVIHINKRDINSIDIEEDEVSLPLDGREGSFEIHIVNHGNPVHVHFSVSKNLRDYVRFLRENPYVRYDETIPVVVKMPPSGATSGEVFVTVGYGSHRAGFTLNLGEVEEEVLIDVDESLSRSQSHHSQPSRRSLETGFKIPAMGGVVVGTGIGVVVLLISLFATGFILEGVQQFFGALFSSILAVSLLALVIFWLTKR